jgi:hypothetical protein
MFVALVLFAALGDPVGRILKSGMAKLHVSGRVGCHVGSAGSGATAL